MVDPLFLTRSVAWKNGVPQGTDRYVPEETAIALTYGGSTQAVMMGTPTDLEDFAVGFSVTEGLIERREDIESLEVIEADDGIELRMWLVPERASIYSRRRRLLAGPTGCGLCGVESLEEAVKPPTVVAPGRVFSPAQIVEAIESLYPAQVLNKKARAVHAAGFWSPETGLVAAREDVGRHNALDKLVGHLVSTGQTAADGVIVLTSRVSVEMVQKAAAIGAPVIVAVSAPTALALRMADAAGITLAAIARGDDFEVFTHHHRIARQEALSEAGA
jgi:FdhD protein